MTSDGSRELASVVVVNFNGRVFLDALLEALARQSYPHVEVVVVDNASIDGSADYLRRHWREIRLIESPENLGFCGGSNLGIRAARGRYIALINNDTVPEHSWLAALVAELESSREIGAVGSKILFLEPFLPITLSTETFNASAVGNSPDTRDLGVLFDETSGCDSSDYALRLFQRGFYGPEVMGERKVRWSGSEGTILVPVGTRKTGTRLRLILSGGDCRGRTCTAKIRDRVLGTFTLERAFEEHVFEVGGETIATNAVDVINNAGSYLSPSGEAGDRGIYAPDQGQFDEAEDVEALCGCAALFRREALNAVGIFDPDFFMYFEDTDLSWRLRNGGYRLRYQPRSVVRHVHAATSKEWSSFFTFHVARNRILMIAKNGALRHLLAALSHELTFVLGLLLTSAGLRSDRSEEARSELSTRLGVQRSLLVKLPKALLKRLGLFRREMSLSRT